MSNPLRRTRSQHRMRSVIRGAAIGLLILSAVAVAVTAVYGALLPLRLAAVFAVATGVVVYLTLDRELIGNRRVHNADRAALVREHGTVVVALLRARSGVPGTAPAPAPALERAAESDRADEVEPADEVGPPGKGTVEDGAADEPAALWDRFGESPEVVDLAAWEERIKVGAEQRRGA